MTDDEQRDAATGLLSRQAFLDEVREVHRLMPQRLRRGCLLILQFPVIQSLGAGVDNDESSTDRADDALCHLLAIVEKRVRTRDTIGRISPHSLCILLKGCKESDAVVVADQYAVLLRDIVISDGKRQLPLDLRYRIVPLDARGSRPRQGVSRLIVAPALQDNARLSKQFDVAGNTVDLSSSKVVSLNAIRDDKSASRQGHDSVDAALPGSGSVLEVGARDSAQSWRLRPGMLIQRKPLICCFRLQPVGVVKMGGSLQNTDLLASMLTALGMSDKEKRPIIESQLILPVQASQIDAQFASWLAAQCKQMRVSPSDICLSLSVESLSATLRSVAPILRQLNRNGVRLMLEGAGSSSQFRMIKNVAQFDYLHVSGRTLNDSYTKVSLRVELESIITEAREQQCEISAGGIDSVAMLNHALAMKVEIGFGRQCGASTSFPDSAWVRSEMLSEQ